MYPIFDPVVFDSVVLGLTNSKTVKPLTVEVAGEHAGFAAVAGTWGKKLISNAIARARR
jgi:hypothetical protein